MTKLSIIIPLYNVENYVLQCIESVEDQDIPSSDYEVIVVNDGSTDSSFAIAEKCKKNYDNITIISQDNQGLSAARNAGVDYAKGNYVWFIDSDDFIEKNCLGEIINELYRNDLDGLRLRHIRFIDGECFYDQRKILRGIVSGQDCLKDYKSYRESACLTIFKRSLLEEHHLRFIVGKIHEDTEFTPKAYYYMQRLVFLDRFVYYYRKNNNSLLYNPSLAVRRFYDLLDVANAMLLFCNVNVDKACQPYYYTRIAFAVNSAFAIADSLENEQEYIKKRLYEKKTLYRSFIKSSELLLKIEGVLLVLFPSYSIKIYHLLNSIKW